MPTLPRHFLRSPLLRSVWLVLPFAGCLAVRTQAAPEPLNLYVSPDGSDVFSGSLARNKGRNDGPFATVTHARDAVRMIRRTSGGKADRPINIVLRGGTYWLAQPLQLTPADSGTADFPVTYMAYENEKPILNAGRAVRGWSTATLNGHAVWAANIRQLKGAADTFHELWVNGQRRVLARLPKKGYFLAGDVPDLGPKTPLQEGQKRFQFAEGDLKNVPDATDADVVLMSLWAESHLPVSRIDDESHTIEFKVPTVHKMAKGDRYFIEGAAEFLDQPGEWYFDRKTGTLYYMPEPGETMIGSEFVIPWHDQILRLDGSPESGSFVEDVHFRGISFTGSEWYPTTDGHTSVAGMKPGGFNQAEWGVPGAIWGQGVRHCVFQECSVSDAGNYGIELGRGCQDNKISYCNLSDLGAGGIKLGETKIKMAEADQARSNDVSDCTIANCGQIFPSAIGIWLGQTDKNLIAHNDIHGLWYTGISVGWTWGYGNALAGENVIEFNDVHHIGAPADGVEPVLSDMGAIYTLGKQPGTVVRNNRFHDIAGLRYGGWGIYFDEGTSGIVAENNLVYRTTHGGFHQHYGAGNVVRNNIFAFGRDAQIQRTRVEDHTSFTFEKNIVYWDKGDLLAGNWAKLNVAFDDNTYWQTSGGELRFAKQSWEQWRQGGMDRHSQIRDPQFVDPAHDDYRLKPGEEKELLGFVPFDVSAAGPRRRDKSTMK